MNKKSRNLCYDDHSMHHCVPVKTVSYTSEQFKAGSLLRVFMVERSRAHNSIRDGITFSQFTASHRKKIHIITTELYGLDFCFRPYGAGRYERNWDL